MNKQDCRVGMVVYNREFSVKAVVVKCNPKKARVRTVEDMEIRRRGYKAGSLWNIPYMYIEPLVGENVKTEMVMRSYENPDNQGIKAYFAHASKADAPVDVQEGSPEWHITKAVCELWRRLEGDSVNEQERRLHSEMMNRLYSILGREVSKDAAENWEAGKIRSEAV